MSDSTSRRRAWLMLLGCACVIGSARASHAEPPALAAPDSAAIARAAVAFPAASVRRWQVGLLRPDRLQHASLSMTLGLAAGLATRSPRIAGYGSLSVGVLKELWDWGTHNGFDMVDLAADAAGAGVAAYGTHAVVE